MPQQLKINNPCLQGEEQALEIAQLINLPRSAGGYIDPFALSWRLGIKVYSAGLSKGIAGMIIVKGGYDPEFYISTKDTVWRSRFACARALGRYLYSINNEPYNSDWGYIDSKDASLQDRLLESSLYAQSFAHTLLDLRMY